MNIFGKKVMFRAIEEDDALILNKWANDPDIQSMLGGWHFPTSMQDQNQWISSLNCNNTNQRFAIELIESKKIIGTTNLVSIDWKNRNAFTGALIGEAGNRGRGLGTDVVMTMMKYAFDELGLNQLDTEIIEYNIASKKTYVDKCGWTIQGVKKNWYYRDGKHCDKMILGISYKDYKNLIVANKYWS